MKNTLYFIAFILIAGWSIGYFGYAQGGLIHVILVMGIIVLMMASTRRKQSL
jgi:hypothetical protein